MNYRITPALLGVLLSGSLLVSGCAATAPSSQEATGTEQAVATTTTRPAATVMPTAPAGSGGTRLSDGTVIASGRVLPEHVVDLGFEVDGMVSEVMVQIGDTVTAGQPLATLDQRNLQLNVDEARAQLAEAKAAYEELIAGATEFEIQRAKAEVAAARARLSSNQQGVTAQEIAAAKAELKEAQLFLERLKAGPRSEDVAIFQAELDAAQARLQTRKDTLAVDKHRIESQIERAANDLRNRQDMYSQIYWANQAKRDANVTLTQDEIDAEAAARRAVENSEKFIGELRLNLEEAQKNEVTEIQTYEADVREARARLNRVLTGALPDEIAVAERRVRQAEARVANLTGPERRFAGEALEAAVLQAEADLAELLADPETSRLAIAEARVARADVQLKQAELDVDRLVVRSPINGIVAAISVSAGQVAQGGAYAFVVADLSRWQIVAANLNELNISQIREGDPVIMTFFAIPGLELPGRVARVETIGRTTDIGTSYNVTITPNSWDERLRWNMSTQVVFLPGS